MSSNTITIAPPAHYSRRQFVDVDGGQGRYTGHGEDYVTRFHRLVRRWRAETAYYSSTTDMLAHPAFVEIVEMGRKVIPLIVEQLRQQPDHLVGALVRITGENPVSNNDRGNIYAAATAWIGWYEQNS